jgi:hypothetical protein
MKHLSIFLVFIVLTLKISGQYMDIKLLISKGAKMINNEKGETPLTWAKSNLNMIQLDDFSWYKDLPFYNELVNSIKSLIEIYSKL